MSGTVGPPSPGLAVVFEKQLTGPAIPMARGNSDPPEEGLLTDWIIQYLGHPQDSEDTRNNHHTRNAEETVTLQLSRNYHTCPPVFEGLSNGKETEFFILSYFRPRVKKEGNKRMCLL